MECFKFHYLSTPEIGNFYKCAHTESLAYEFI